MNKIEIDKNNFTREIEDYLDKIIYLEDVNFSDGVHLKKNRECISELHNENLSSNNIMVVVLTET